jgi:uncharacterized membrane-anchored protein
MLNLVALILFVSFSLLFIFRIVPEDQFLMIIELSQYQIELKSTIVFVAFILLFLAIVFLVFFVVNLYNSYRLREVKSISRNSNKLQLFLGDFIKNISLGDVENSNKSLKQIKKHIDNKSYLFRFLNLQNVIIQADNKKIKTELLSFNNDFPNDVFILNSLGIECNKNNDFETSIEYLERSLLVNFKSPATISTLIHNYFACDEYHKIEALLKKAYRKRVIESVDFIREEALNNLALARFYFRKNELKKYYKYSDLAYKNDSSHQYIFNNYIKSLFVRKKETKAINLILKEWDRFAHPKLSEYLINVLKDKGKKYKIKITTQLVEKNFYDVQSFIIFAEINMNNADLHDDIKKYLERAINITRTKKVVELMLEIKSKYYPDSDEEIIKLKNSLNDSLPEYQYSCQNCHTNQEHWQMVCNNCFQIDQIALKLETSNKIKFLDIAK